MALNKIKINNITNVNTGVVYDITKATSQSYDSLSAALGTNGNNVPPEVREGGMSIRFVQTSDNKYVQYRLMSDSFNTTESNWQGVDDKPTTGSKNLVESGSVEYMLNNKAEIETSQNIYDYNNTEILLGYYADNGNFYPSDSYYSVLIPVKENTAYVVPASIPPMKTVLQVNFYNAVGSNLSYYTIPSGQSTIQFTTPSDCARISITVFYPGDNPPLDQYMVIEGTTYPASYIPYQKYLGSDIKVNRTQVEITLPTDIVIIGDSTAKGDDGQPYKGHANIKDWLQYFTNNNIVDNGIWGDTLDGITARFQTDVLDLHPKYCIILCGTNDISNGVVPDNMAAKARNLIELMLNNNIIPIMLSICPRSDNNAELYNNFIREYNMRLEIVCMQYNNCYFINTYPKLCKSDGTAKDGVLYDGLHFTSYGAYLCAKYVAETGYIVNNSGFYGIMPISNDFAYNRINNPELAIFNEAEGVAVANDFETYGDTIATFSKELRTDIKGYNGYDLYYQVIEKQATNDVQQAGIYQRSSLFAAGYKFRICVEAEFDMPNGDNDTSFNIVFTMWNSDSGVSTIYDKVVEAYRLKQGKATFWFDEMIPSGTNLCEIAIYAYGKSACTLKIGRIGVCNIA